MKYVITLRSVHTGEETHLGSQYDTRAEAEAYADKEVCHRCNGVKVRAIPDDHVWIDRHHGFWPRDYVGRIRDQEMESQLARIAKVSGDQLLIIKRKRMPT